MKSAAFQLKHLLPMAAVYLLAHAICIRLGAPHALQFSYPFMIATPCLAMAACLWKVRQSGPRLALAWSTIASGVTMWMFGMVASAVQFSSQNRIPSLNTLSGFLFFAFGIPILLVIASPMEGEREPLFAWLDSLQAACVGCLVYVMLFGALPFQPHPAHVASMGLILNGYNAESLFLAVAATIRLFLHARSREEGRMFWILSAFLWVYGLSAAMNNYLVVRLGNNTGYVDLLADVPFLLLAVFTLSPPVRPADSLRVVQERHVAMYIDNASHIVAMFTLLVLGAVNVKRHFHLGMVSIALSVAIYAMRTTVLQNRLLRSQRDLREAKVRLEALSLEDPLTGVANRRCFDVALEREWKRATRNGDSLSLMMIDLDHFKLLNDKHGHVYGDECLMKVARTLSLALPRRDDLVARYGGEEFAAILVATDCVGAEVVAERMRLAVAGLGVTVSLGIATFHPTQAEHASVMVEAADKALYRAKQEGRNRFVSHDARAVAGSDVSKGTRN